jgi:hypothetical protein
LCPGQGSTEAMRSHRAGAAARQRLASSSSSIS